MTEEGTPPGGQKRGDGGPMQREEGRVKS